MSTKCLKLINQGQFEIIPITTKDLYEEAVQIFRDSFLKYENLCTACKVLESKEATDGLIQHLKDMFQDGISFAARHVESKQLAALCANKFLCNSDNFKSEATSSNWSPTPNLQKIKHFLDYVESTHDIYKLWQLECVIDLTFLCTKPEFGQKGLALSLAAYTIDYCRRLKDVNSEEYQALPQHLHGQHPQAVTAIFTSKFTQSIGDKLGFTTIHLANYKDFTFDGQTFAERIDPQHTYANFAAIRL